MLDAIEVDCAARIAMANLIGLFLLSLLACCFATPTELGLKFDKRSGHLPTLTLPYGTWQATKYNADIYLFKNIRFGAPPLGKLRWAKPAPPLKETIVQNGSYGPICIPAFKNVSLVQLPPDPVRDKNPPGSGGTQLPGGAFIPFPPFSEDCLFLDVYIPAKAIENHSTGLPVISWFYGGGFLGGGKDPSTPLLPFYDGKGVIAASKENVIFVASNHRTGVYGFLAGTTMEKEGLPNVGLYDQRAALQWIHDYIGLLGGDKTQVSAWGESSGAGSIIQHLTAFGGTQDPLFSRAVLFSPGLPPSFDRKGNLEQAFQNFATRAGCAGKGLACLRAARPEALKAASDQGNYAVFPSADGKYVRQAATLELASGNYWKHLDSIVLSHVLDEASTFVPDEIKTDQDFSNYLSGIIPPYGERAGLKSRIIARYPPVGDGRGTYATERQRFAAFFGDFVFLCGIRGLSDAYTGKNYNVEYSQIPYTHGADTYAQFYFPGFNLSLLNLTGVAGFSDFAQTYQSYLISQVWTGDPNVYRKSYGGFKAIRWPKSDSRGDALRGVLNVTGTGFELIIDEQTKKSTCKFWEEIVKELTELGGYAPIKGHKNLHY